MKTRALHRITGLVMLLPLIGWAVTGAVFFLKPGYAGAYETLQVKSYPLEGSLTLQTDPTWTEVRFLNTVLGEHLLARTSKGWVHLNQSLTPRPEPSPDEIRTLVADAISANAERYGQIKNVDGMSVETD